MKKIVALSAVLLVAAALYAASFTVTYVEGSVEIQKGSGWMALDMGDSVDGSQVVRLGAGAMAEFTDGRSRIVLSAAGIYSLATIAKRSSDDAKKRSETIARLSVILNNDVSKTYTSGQAAVGGTRGADESSSGSGPDMEWMGDDEAGTGPAQAPAPAENQAVTDARALSVKGDFTAAASAWAAVAADNSVPEALRSEARYARAYALAAAGSMPQAIKALRAMSGSEAFAGPRAILLARLDLGSGAHDEAICVLQDALDSSVLRPEDEALVRSLLQEAEAGH